VPCGRYPTPGSRRCKFHGGAKAKLLPGDPGRGGAQVTTGLYATVLRDGDLAAYALARGSLGNLDEEIALARAQLHKYLDKHGLDIDGARIKSKSTSKDGSSASYESHMDVVLAHLDKIAKLERIRSEMLEAGATPHDDLEAHEEWLKRAGSRPPSSSALSSSQPPKEPT